MNEHVIRDPNDRHTDRPIRVGPMDSNNSAPVLDCPPWYREIRIQSTSDGMYYVAADAQVNGSVVSVYGASVPIGDAERVVLLLTGGTQVVWTHSEKLRALKLNELAYRAAELVQRAPAERYRQEELLLKELAALAPASEPKWRF